MQVLFLKCVTTFYKVFSALQIWTAKTFLHSIHFQCQFCSEETYAFVLCIKIYFFFSSFVLLFHLRILFFRFRHIYGNNLHFILSFPFFSFHWNSKQFNFLTNWSLAGDSFKPTTRGTRLSLYPYSNPENSWPSIAL